MTSTSDRIRAFLSQADHQEYRDPSPPLASTPVPSSLDTMEIDWVDWNGGGGGAAHTAVATTTAVTEANDEGPRWFDSDEDEVVTSAMVATMLEEQPITAMEMRAEAERQQRQRPVQVILPGESEPVTSKRRPTSQHHDEDEQKVTGVLKRSRSEPLVQMDVRLNYHPSFSNMQAALDQFNACARATVVKPPPPIEPQSVPPRELVEKPLDHFLHSIYRTILYLRAQMAAQLRQQQRRNQPVATVAAASTDHPHPWQASLERRTFSHMNALLVEAGSRPSPVNAELTIHSPPCLRGDECQAFQVFKFKLMTSMSEHELTEHEARGTVPATRLPCVLCELHIISCLQDNATNLMALPSGVLAQWFWNPVDEEDGYDSTVCHVPMQSSNGLIAPVLRYNHAALQPYRDRMGVQRLNQSLLRYVPKNGPTGVGLQRHSQ